MDKKYGLRGTIVPQGVGDERFSFEGFQIETRDGVLEIAYADSADESRARDIVRQYLAWFSVHRGTRYTLDLDETWELKAGGAKDIGIAVADVLRHDDSIRTTKVSIKGVSCIATADFDSMRVSNASEMVRKSQSETALAKALMYLSEEVVDDDRPLYGIYKAIEALTEARPPGGKIKAQVERSWGSSQATGGNTSMMSWRLPN